MYSKDSFDDRTPRCNMYFADQNSGVTIGSQRCDKIQFQDHVREIRFEILFEHKII